MRFFVLLLSFMFLPLMVMAEEEENAKPSVDYLEMAPKLTVNLAERRKYLLVKVQLLIKGRANTDRINEHMPAMRHELLMFLSGKSEEELQTALQREAARKESFNRVKAVLDKYSSSEGLEDLFFTAFLIN